MISEHDTTPPEGLPTSGIRVAKAIERAERKSSRDAIGMAARLALIAAEELGVQVTAADVQRLEDRYRPFLEAWATHARLGLIQRLDRIEGELDAATAAVRARGQYERLRRRHVDLRRRIRDVGESYPEVMEVLNEDR